MRKYFPITFSFIFSVVLFSFVFKKDEPATEIKKMFQSEANVFAGETGLLQQAIEKSDEKLIHIQFLKTRAAYKRIEVFAEYFYPDYSARMNGAPIPTYDETEPEKGAQAPTGFQLIESYLYPKLNKATIKSLYAAAVQLNRWATEMPRVTESVEFNDANIIDAIMEQFYRITALGIVGFDAQLSGNGLPECKSSLQSLAEILSNYNHSINNIMPGKYAKLTELLTKSIQALDQSKSFDTFDRMNFTLRFLNPLAQLVGEYKIRNGYKDNPGGQYYSTISKNNSLFDPLAFNPYRYIDDYTSSVFKIRLGQKLFYDKRLSANKQRSCASCHQPAKAFTDGLKTSTALDGHTALLRNAPTLINAALQRSLFYDARSRTLEDQVMAVLSNINEMHGTAATAAENIVSLPEYARDYQQAYPKATKANAAINVCNAIASYERRLIALNSRFDQHMRGEKTLTPDEINGYNIFMGKGKCGSCHFTPLFNGSRPPRYYVTETEVLGVPQTLVQKNAKLSSDSGRYLVTRLPMHLYAFKTPGLRNVALTAPYMHNGVYKTLEEVIDFYNNGGGRGLGIAPENQTLPFDKLNLTKKEKRDLILFMQSLTDTVTNIDQL